MGSIFLTIGITFLIAIVVLKFKEVVITLDKNEGNLVNILKIGCVLVALNAMGIFGVMIVLSYAPHQEILLSLFNSYFIYHFIGLWGGFLGIFGGLGVLLVIGRSRGIIKEPEIEPFDSTRKTMLRPKIPGWMIGLKWRSDDDPEMQRILKAICYIKST